MGKKKKKKKNDKKKKGDEKKAAPKKTAAKKAAPKKTAAEKAAPKKTAAEKAAPKKTAAKKTTRKATRKRAPRKAAASKVVAAPATAPTLVEPPASPYLVPFDGSFRVADASHEPPKGAPSGKKGKKENKDLLEEQVEEIYELQRKLYADDRYSLLLVFQAMDAAGKDGTIRAVMTGVNPAGCQVSSFKAPSKEEIDHDFLWRIHACLPERGRIGIFNRSHYEEVLIVKVHPEYLAGQRLPRVPEDVFLERYESIRDWEKHLARNGTVILKFFLNVSREEQRERLLERIDDERKNWKFEAGDLDTRDRWDLYMDAYQEALNATSRPWAPWYAIPADDKPFMRQTVARIVREALEGLGLSFPEVSPEQRAELQQHRKRLEKD